jgi:hypothetical protein
MGISRPVFISVKGIALDSRQRLSISKCFIHTLMVLELLHDVNMLGVRLGTTY